MGGLLLVFVLGWLVPAKTRRILRITRTVRVMTRRILRIARTVRVMTRRILRITRTVLSMTRDIKIFRFWTVAARGGGIKLIAGIVRRRVTNAPSPQVNRGGELESRGNLVGSIRQNGIRVGW